ERNVVVIDPGAVVVVLPARPGEAEGRGAGRARQTGKVDRVEREGYGRTGDREDVGEAGAVVVRKHEAGGAIRRTGIGHVEAHLDAGVVARVDAALDVLTRRLVAERLPRRGVVLPEARVDRGIRGQ